MRVKLSVLLRGTNMTKMNIIMWIDVKSPHITVKGIISEHNKGDKVNQ